MPVLTHVGGSRVQYHNAVHAADVLQAVYSMMSVAELLPRVTDVELFAVVVAAAAHGARATPARVVFAHCVPRVR